MELNYIIIILIVFILIVLFKYNSDNSEQNNYNNNHNQDNLYDSDIEKLKREAEAEAKAELKTDANASRNYIKTELKITKAKKQPKYKLNFHYSPDSPETHSFLPVWNIIQQEAPPDVECNDINCSSKQVKQSTIHKSKKPSLILTIDEEDEYDIPLIQDYKKLKEKLSLYDIHLDNSNSKLPNELVESFQTHQELEKKMYNICHHDTFFTRMKDKRNPGGYIHCIKNNPYVKGCTTVNPQLGLNNFSNVYNMVSSYIDTIPDDRKEIHQFCARKYKQNFKDLGLCLPGKLKEYANFDESINQKTHKYRLPDGHHYYDNKHYSDIIQHACRS